MKPQIEWCEKWYEISARCAHGPLIRSWGGTGGREGLADHLPLDWLIFIHFTIFLLPPSFFNSSSILQKQQLPSSENWWMYMSIDKEKSYNKETKRVFTSISEPTLLYADAKEICGGCTWALTEKKATTKKQREFLLQALYLPCYICWCQYVHENEKVQEFRWCFSQTSCSWKICFPEIYWQTNIEYCFTALMWIAYIPSAYYSATIRLT